MKIGIKVDGAAYPAGLAIGYWANKEEYHHGSIRYMGRMHLYM